MSFAKRMSIGCILLGICLCALCFCATPAAFAYETSGKCGDNITWSYDASSQTLTLAGSGETNTNYSSSDSTRWKRTRTPWVIDDWAKDVKTINVGEGITALHNYVFYGCTTATTISLPTTLTEIGRSTFQDCKAVKDLDFSKTHLVTTSYYPFDGCEALESVELPEGITSLAYGFYNNTASLKTVNWPSTLTELGGGMFWQSGITEMEIPATITKMDRDTFEQCPNLTTVKIDAQVSVMGSVDKQGNITSDATFSDCPKLKSVTLPSTLTAIGPSCFYNCPSLESISLSSTQVKSIGGAAFENCTALSSIDWDSACTSIGLNAFRNCSSLTNIVLPSSITSIGMNAYQGCENLHSIVIPATTTSVEPHAFDAIAPLSTVYVVGKDLYTSMIAYPSLYVDTDRTEIVYGKKSFTPTVEMGSWTVGEHASTPHVSGNESNGKVSYEYYSDEALTKKISLDTATAGTYYVKATIAETDTYQSETATSSFKIVQPSGQLVNTFTGNDRYNTMRAIISASLNRSDVAPSGAIVVTGETYADALTAAGLSKVLNYPIVTTRSQYVDPETTATLETLSEAHGAKLDIIVLGGTNAISDDTTSVIANYDNDGTVTRLSGDTRYQTAEAVYDYGTTHGGWGSNPAIVATGVDFPDALSASAYAAAKGAPILLTDGQTTDNAVLNDVATQKSAIVLGGENVISADAYSTIASHASASCQRIAGSDRYETSSLFIKWECAQGMTLDGMGFATGTNFPDALTASYYLGLKNAVVDLVPDSTYADPSSYFSRLKSDEAGASITSINVFGGTNVIDESTRSQLTEALNWSNPQLFDRTI
jgi:putative cell wall-binding protein